MRKVNKDTRRNNQKVKNSQGSNKSRHQTPKGDRQPKRCWLAGWGVRGRPGSVGDLMASSGRGTGSPRPSACKCLGRLSAQGAKELGDGLRALLVPGWPILRG